jgi:hypothetical protein
MDVRFENNSNYSYKSKLLQLTLDNRIYIKDE